MEPTNIEDYRKKKLSPKRPSRKPTFIIYFLLIIVGFYFFLHSAFFNIRNIEITGNQFLNNEKVLELSQINHQQNIMFIKKNQVIQRIMVHPLAKDVEITRRMPNTLKINILERKPVALLVAQDGFIQVSEDGYFLALVKTINNYQIPILSGIDMDYLPGPGQEIQNPDLLILLDIINKSDHEILSHLAEINIKDTRNILVYSTEGIEIRFGNLERIDEKLEIISELVNNNLGDQEFIDYIDLRFSGSSIIKKKP